MQILTQPSAARSLRTFDRQARRRETRKQRRAFQSVRQAETHYREQLLKIARQVGGIADLFVPNDPQSLYRMVEALRGYAETITPWARSVAAGMLADVSHRDEVAWTKLGDLMGRAIRSEIATAPTGELMRVLQNEQVAFIKSLPLEAAQRVQRLAEEGLATGARSDEIERMIMATGHVAKGRAKLIARTEVGRASSSLTEARATHVRIETYIWRSAGDSDVRPLHRKLNGHVFRFDHPPVSGQDGERSNPGAIYNCRCYSEPVLT